MKQSKLNVLQPHNSLLSGTAVCCLETAYNVSLICFLNRLCVFIANQFFGFYIFFFFLQAQIILVSIANEGASIEL